MPGAEGEPWAGRCAAFVALCGAAALQRHLPQKPPRELHISKRPRNAPCAPRRVRMSAGMGYAPSEDDRPESAPKVPTELTLAQELLLKQYESQVERMSTKDCQELALEIARQMMVKDNILRSMLKKEVPFGAEPPEPMSFKEADDS